MSDGRAKVLGWATLLACLAAVLVASAATPADYKRARNLFEYGDYAACVPLLEELVLPGRLEDEADIASAHRMLGVAYYHVGRKQEAGREFKSLLYINPDEQLDPFLTPPEVVEFFDTVRADMGARLPELREQRARERAQREQADAGRERPVSDDAPPKTTVVTRRVRVVPWAALFLPFGIPQFLMGHWVRGAAVLALALAAPLPSMAFFALGWVLVGDCVRLLGAPASSDATSLVNLEGCNPFGGQRTVYESDRTRRTVLIGLSALQYVSLLLIPTAYMAGLADAFIFPDLEVLEGESATTRQAPSPRPEPVPAPADVTSR
ncbi:MAG: hypothetical protein HY904_09670 [Deltaproteobacteria bacterium]|nr:hypothetical protein [Deltaproteobacteria bacterium]